MTTESAAAAAILWDLRGERYQLADLAEQLQAVYLAPLLESADLPAAAACRVAMVRQHLTGALAALDQLLARMGESLV
jgi:hypothetical protein